MGVPKEIKENCLNGCDADDNVYVTTFQRKYMNQIEALQEAHPDEVRIIARNDNGTMYACLDRKYVHVNFSDRRKREITEEQKAAAGERLRRVRANKRVELNG